MQALFIPARRLLSYLTYPEKFVLLTLLLLLVLAATLLPATLPGLEESKTVATPLALIVLPIAVYLWIGFYLEVREELARRAAIEADMQAAAQAAETATRAKSEFLATMSHEIRTPMNGVLGMAGLLRGTALTPQQRDYAETIHDSAEMLLGLVDDILDYSRLESGKMELEARVFDLRACLESVLDLEAPRAAEKDLDLAYGLEPGTPALVVGDVTRLRQILLNLVNNAIKFTEHGEVAISTSSRPVPGTDGASAGYELHFAVRDTGIGIPADRMGRLFRSFSQVDASTARRYGGSGLGLAISKRLAELMGGSIWAESQEGQGSTFHFTVRATAADAAAPAPDTGALAGRHLLIIDPNPTRRAHLALVAEGWGLVTRATDAADDALAWLAAGDPADVALLGPQPGPAEGPAVLAAIRRRRPGLPLVLLAPAGHLRSEADHGAVMLSVPVKQMAFYQALVAAAAPTAGAAARPARNGAPTLRILLAEDNPVDQKLTQHALARLGSRADLVQNGREVLQALEHQAYDVVLLDVEMPQLDGLETARAICDRLPAEARPRLIALSAGAADEERAACLAAGIDVYLSKPVELEALATALAHPAVPAPAPNGHTAPAPGDAPLDWAALATLRADLQAGGDSDLLPEIIALFQRGTPVILRRMHAALDAGDAAVLRGAAHELKGSSRSLGARPLAALCEALERQARAGALAEADALIAAIEREFERVCRAFAALAPLPA